MLFSVPDLKQMTTIPHKNDFDIWRSRISDSDFEAIIDKLNDMIDGTEVQTAGWMPGNDWRGTEFQPIFEACNQDFEASGRFFGQIVWYTFMHHPDSWSFGKFDKDGISIHSLTYFRIERPT